MVSVSPENVATPPDAVTVSVPPSVAPPGLFASATVTVPLKEVIEVARAVLGLDRQAEAAARGDAGRRLLRHHQLRRGEGDDADRAGAGIGEPEVAVGARRDPDGVGTGVGDGVLGDGVGRRVDHHRSCRLPDSVNQRLPSGPAVIPSGSALAVGTANSVMAWVVGLIIPIWLALYSVNQRLPSGPAVIPSGSDLAVGMANSVMAWVVGLIIADLVGAVLGEPEVAVGARRDPVGTGIGGGDGELGDGVGRRVDHPDLVGAALGEPEVAVGARRDPVGPGSRRWGRGTR